MPPARFTPHLPRREGLASATPLARRPLWPSLVGMDGRRERDSLSGNPPPASFQTSARNLRVCKLGLTQEEKAHTKKSPSDEELSKKKKVSLFLWKLSFVGNDRLRRTLLPVSLHRSVCSPHPPPLQISHTPPPSSLRTIIVS